MAMDNMDTLPWNLIDENLNSEKHWTNKREYETDRNQNLLPK